MVVGDAKHVQRKESRPPLPANGATVSSIDSSSGMATPMPSMHPSAGHNKKSSLHGNGGDSSIAMTPVTEPYDTLIHPQHQPDDSRGHEQHPPGGSDSQRLIPEELYQQYADEPSLPNPPSASASASASSTTPGSSVNKPPRPLASPATFPTQAPSSAERISRSIAELVSQHEEKFGK